MQVPEIFFGILIYRTKHGHSLGLAQQAAAQQRQQVLLGWLATARG